MKKTLYSLIVLLMLIGCSSSNEQEVTLQMDNVKWSWDGKDSEYCPVSEEEVSKQLDLLELVPGPQQFKVWTEKKPGETLYTFALCLKLRLKHTVELDISEILADNKRKLDANSHANITFYLLDRNGERIPMETPWGPYYFYLILFNQRECYSETFVDYLNILQSEPGTVFTLCVSASFSDQDYKCDVGFSNLIKEVKGVELCIESDDEDFEEYVGEIK